MSSRKDVRVARAGTDTHLRAGALNPHRPGDPNDAPRHRMISVTGLCVGPVVGSGRLRSCGTGADDSRP
jgi:hypothetical protein